MGRVGKAVKGEVTPSDFKNMTFHEMALIPYPEYPDHYLSTTKRSRCADVVRSQKDLWAKDDKPHQWVRRTNVELRGQAGLLPPRRAQPQPDNGKFLQSYYPLPPADTEAVYSQHRPPRNKSVLCWTDQGLVGSDDTMAMAQFREYGKRPGASEWSTTYAAQALGQATDDELKKKPFLEGLFHMGGRKSAPLPPPRTIVRRKKKAAAGEGEEDDRLKGYDKEIKNLAASVKMKVKERSASVELHKGLAPVAFDWTGKGVGPLGRSRAWGSKGSRKA